LPARIEALEAEQRELGAFLAQPESYTKEADRAMQAQARHAKIDDELLAAMERWEALGAR
jgi:ABC transport system ATP-binding/permease protein